MIGAIIVGAKVVFAVSVTLALGILLWEIERNGDWRVKR